ncbi:MAG TPA: exonuclease SbcCD subunit D [Candidatus Saccharimonadales bacterium]|nr:exonuclease SbcCD subunit D [Candidatus Saccharimonadales bacterium]
MIRFIHTADIHFGMENYGKIDPQTGIHSRLLDFKQSFDICVDYAIEHEVDLFVFAGDAYKTANPSPTQQKLLMQSFMRLYRAHIPVVIVVGNHDNPLSYGKANALDIFAHLPIDGFYVFSKPESLTIQTKSGPIQIVAIPWPNRHNVSINFTHFAQSATELTKHISDSLASIISKLAQELQQDIPAILVGHLTVSSGIFSGSEKRAVYGHDPILLPSQLAIKPFDYVALGHLHRFQCVNQGDPIPVVYAGSIDRIDFGERKEEKGFCDVTIQKKYDTRFVHVPIKTRPFIQIDVVLNEHDDQTEQILQALAKHTMCQAVVKITYEIPSTLTDMVDVKKIQKYCFDAMHIVGIIPIRAVQTRAHRDLLKNEMNLETLLQTYFQSQDSLKKRASVLTEKALRLDELQEACDGASHEEN